MRKGTGLDLREEKKHSVLSIAHCNRVALPKLAFMHFVKSTSVPELGSRGGNAQCALWTTYHFLANERGEINTTYPNYDTLLLRKAFSRSQYSN